MATDPGALLDALTPLIAPQARERLLAQGLARGIVWRDGELPEGAPNFPSALTEDLLDFGYGVLAIALEVSESAEIEAPDARAAVVEGFRVAAETIESAARRASASQPLRAFHLLLSAAAFHLKGFTAIDIKAYYMGATGCDWDDTRSSRITAKLGVARQGDHIALNDALLQAELFRVIRRLSSERTDNRD